MRQLAIILQVIVLHARIKVILYFIFAKEIAIFYYH